MNQFLHKRKIPKIPPVRNNRNILVTNVSEKANVVNSFFANQCSLIDANSFLPPDVYRTDQRLEHVNFDEAKLRSFIRALNVNKAHGWDEISIRMVKICGESLIKPLINIFSLSLSSGKFPKVWLKITDQVLYCQYSANFLKSVFSTHSTSISSPKFDLYEF